MTLLHFVDWKRMKSLARFFLTFVFAAFVVPHCFAVDTLEVFALRVQFQEEKTDNSLTTGTGIFDSDKKDKDAYSLDPVGRRGSVSYWQKHFDFANAYFQAASGGKMAVKARIFPEASSGQSVYTLDKQIIDYNRTKKLKDEKTAEYDEARSRDYLSFIYDVVMKVHKSKNSPFSIPLSKNPNTKRAYMIIHAGASRLVDGGSMGTDGADTPGDFMDIYISNDAWEYLSPDSEFVAVKKVKNGSSSGKDSSVVTGLVLEKAAMDTLKTMMVVSETASQDGLNWGINGILVNQLGREMGLPNTYDVVKGISRLGYFDLMDFAGYSAGNGFMPALPNAWNRSYMGWSKVKEVRPTAGHPVSVDIVAAGSGISSKGAVEIVKVPLSASEYLLIENRQRSWNKDGTVDVVLGTTNEDLDTTVKTVPVDSLNLVFEDSVCVKGKCSVNKKKAKGLIVGISSYDAGIPASGIAVWKVNEWYLRETLEYGVANFWGGDTLRDHQFGISLIEADGVLSIGKTFKNALGQDSYDYGSGTDLLPHKRYSKKKKYDMVTSIMPTGYANTQTTQGGYTGIKISVDVPKNARTDTTMNAFMGDSVINYSAPVIRVTVSVDDGSIEGANFPKNVGLASAVHGTVFLNNAENEDEKIIVFGADDGTLQAMGALGDSLFVADTVVKTKKLSVKDSVQEVPLYRLGLSNGALVGMSSDGENVYSLHGKALVRTKILPGMVLDQDVVRLDSDGDSALVGPVIADDGIWIATRKALRKFKDGNRPSQGSSKGSSLKGESLWEAASFEWQDFKDNGFDGSSFVAHDMVYCPNGNEATMAVVDSSGRLFIAGNEPKGVSFKHADDRLFRLACTDVNRDGTNDIIVLGSRGSITGISGANKQDSKHSYEPFYSHVYKRGAALSYGVKDETSGMAIGDINDDGYPEVVFLGNNLVYAVDRFGLPIEGFPVTLNRGNPVVGFFSDPLIVDVTGDKIPEILVPSSEGLVYAVTGKGKLVKDGFPIAAGSFESEETYSPMSIYVTDAVEKSKGPELYAFHRNGVSAFRLGKAIDGAEREVSAWSLPAAGDRRTGYFDASSLHGVQNVEARDEISEFFIYPNPVRSGDAHARIEVLSDVKSAELEFYDITGLVVYAVNLQDLVRGRNQVDHLDLSKLGSDVYTARLKVKFADGKSRQKLYRVGVIR